ncbi:hypothetical protein GCM10010357_17050 [Streptomyces luteireticuli]|uniref:Uncharacterized protein n=1 Tax=Streptomyces luteireticuli TaxID=173858 RepID=A0ABP3IDN3_9ACTN
MNSDVRLQAGRRGAVRHGGRMVARGPEEEQGAGPEAVQRRWAGCVGAEAVARGIVRERHPRELVSRLRKGFPKTAETPPDIFPIECNSPAAARIWSFLRRGADGHQIY